MPKSMQVHYGTQPNEVDEAVVFRTTYYFRVFGDCYSSNNNGELPNYSGLYRFRMTGKARALTNKVKFESGILPAESIDPFGKLRFDPEDIDSLALIDQQLEDRTRAIADVTELLEKLKTWRAEVGNSNIGTPEVRIQFDKAFGTLAEQLSELQSLEPPEEYRLTLRRIENVQKVLETTLERLSPQLKDEALALRKELANEVQAAFKETIALLKGIAAGKSCTANNRGFLILGPEGWKQFDPADRLIMAMYSSGRPLIATLNELSARASRPQGPLAETSLAFAEQNARIANGLAELRSYQPEKPETAISAIESAIGKLKEEDTP